MICFHVVFGTAKRYRFALPKTSCFHTVLGPPKCQENVGVFMQFSFLFLLNILGAKTLLFSWLFLCLFMYFFGPENLSTTITKQNKKATVFSPLFAPFAWPKTPADSAGFGPNSKTDRFQILPDSRIANHSESRMSPIQTKQTCGTQSCACS